VSVVKPHIVFLPGNMCDARLWGGPKGPICQAVSDVGWTYSFPKLGYARSISDMAARALKSHEGPLVPVGFSMGGIIALEMARMAMDRLVGLVLIDTTARADLRGSERLRQQEAVRAGHLERVVREELKPNYLASCNSDNLTMLALLRTMALDLGPDVFIAQSEALRTRADLSPVLPQLSMPVLLACGEEDRLCPPTLQQTLADEIPKSKPIVFAKAGHLLPLEQPNLLASALSSYFTSLPE
jgi:pimeloyl-ACP methyl ester carboxylesterase